MPTDKSLDELIVNKLTRKQYEGIESPSDTELYFVTDDSSIVADSDGNAKLTLAEGKTFTVEGGKGLKLTWGVETGDGSKSTLNGIVEVNGILRVPSSSTMSDASGSQITWTKAELDADHYTKQQIDEMHTSMETSVKAYADNAVSASYTKTTSEYKAYVTSALGALFATTSSKTEPSE